MNLSADQYSDGLRLQVAFTVSEQSFDKSSESISRNTAGKVPKRQAENMARALSQDFDEFYKTREIEVHDNSSLLVLTCDGKGIVMRQSDLRAATQKAAESAQHKKQTRLSKGEKSNRKRMATVASVYDIEPHVRSAGSIMGSEEKNSQTPKPSNKRVWASVEKSSLQVIEQMFSEALRRDPNQKRKWVVLVDGQSTQLKQIRRSSTKRNLSSKERENADKCSDYLLKKKDYLRYDKCLVEGYPIATGVIEGACRYLVKDRMDITGARWGLEGAEAVLKLRAIVSSKDFEEYFRFHKKKERSRNYPFYDKIAYKMAA